MRGHLKYISQRLSLREPQSDALSSLAKLLDKIGLPTQEEVDFETLKEEFPQLKAFERGFPNVCFSLATGVGKTRLMGALLTYLYLEKRVRNFLILAPNNTILEKLEKDFSDPTHSKYVFRGISEFAVKKPRIITAGNFEQGVGVRNSRAKQGDLFGDEHEAHINIFNIAKMHTDKRKIKQINDYLDESYFEYLASLDDLVIFMDEAHRYRASAAMKTIEELNPLLGLEFTATPQIEKPQGPVRFKNILYDYPLGVALQDGFLKEPAIAGRENFNPKNFASEQELDRLKIQDALSIHEMTKFHLREYTTDMGLKEVKPLILIVAQDTKHANELMEIIEGNDFFGGNYKGKVLVVHSELKAEVEEKMVRNLLEVESSENPIEIVIHVNMLREGWDIVNLFTMVPLRKANSKTLIEQNLGRGLRLPFGHRTGIREIDTHTVVSHDRFNEIIDAANREDSVIRRGVVIGKDASLEPLMPIETQSRERLEIEKIEDEGDRTIKLSAYSAIHERGLETKEEVVEYVQRELGALDLAKIQEVEVFIECHLEKMLYIPRISIQPKVTQKGRFLPFELDLSGVTNRPFENGILTQRLRTGERKVYEAKHSVDAENSPERQLVRHLVDFDEIAENDENNEVAFQCSEQMVRHFRSYLDEGQIARLIRQQGRHLAGVLRAQMLRHFEAPIVKWEDSIKEQLIPLQNKRLFVPQGSRMQHYTIPVDDKLNTREIVFEGYKKSLYPRVKFDSDSERIFSTILEQDEAVKKWLKPGRSVFSFIHYTKDARYEPDFIIESEKNMFLCEIKRRSELTSSEVLAKAHAAAHWCHLATQHTHEKKKKPWSYLLVPHDVLHLSMTIEGLAARHTFIYKKEE